MQKLWSESKSHSADDGFPNLHLWMYPRCSVWPNLVEWFVESMNDYYKRRRSLLANGTKKYNIADMKTPSITIVWKVHCSYTSGDKILLFVHSSIMFPQTCMKVRAPTRTIPPPDCPLSIKHMFSPQRLYCIGLWHCFANPKFGQKCLFNTVGLSPCDYFLAWSWGRHNIRCLL